MEGGWWDLVVGTIVCRGWIGKRGRMYKMEEMMSGSGRGWLGSMKMRGWKERWKQWERIG